jgi:hypothetical protein
VLPGEEHRDYIQKSLTIYRGRLPHTGTAYLSDNDMVFTYQPRCLSNQRSKEIPGELKAAFFANGGTQCRNYRDHQEEAGANVVALLL